MANPLADIWSFGVAGALPDGQLLVAAYADDMLKEWVSEATLLWFDGVRMSIAGKIDDYVRAIKPDGASFAVVTEAGILLKVSNGKIERNMVLPKSSPKAHPFGPIRACYSVNGSIMVGGLNHTVVLFDESGGQLVDLSRGLVADKTPGIEALDGFGFNEIYGVDLYGGIWRFDGTSWHDCSSPTNQLLTSVCCTSSGDVYAAGRHGVLLKGRYDTWNILDFDLSSFDIYSVAEWAGQIFLSGARGILTLLPDNSGVDVVDFGAFMPTSFYHVISAGDILWSVGPKDIAFCKDGLWTPLFK